MAETSAFQAAFQQLMTLISITFYSNKEAFLREPLANASGTLNKIRYESIANLDTIVAQPHYIYIVPNKNKYANTIEDSGIGVTKYETINKF